MNAQRTTSTVFALQCFPRKKQTLNLQKVAAVGAVQFYLNTLYLNPRKATFLIKRKSRRAFVATQAHTP